MLVRICNPPPVVGEVKSVTEGDYAGVLIGMIPFGKKIRQFAGGAFKKLFKKKGKVERHHMPSRKSLEESGVDINPNTDAPALEMDIRDHKKTASWGRKKSGAKFRKKEIDLLKKGDIEGAQQLGIDDIKSQFGNKYNQGLNQLKKYTNDLIKKKKNPN